MSGNPWIDHVRAYAKQRGISYMCAISDPNCSKSYKEGKTPTTKTKAITAPASAPASAPVAAKAVAKTVAPKTESSSTNDNTFREIDINNPPKINPPFYVYAPYASFLNKIIKVRQSSRTGDIRYTVEKHDKTKWASATINNKEYSLLHFNNNAEFVREETWADILNYKRKALISNSFNFNQPLKIRKDKY